MEVTQTASGIIVDAVGLNATLQDVQHDPVAARNYQNFNAWLLGNSSTSTEIRPRHGCRKGNRCGRSGCYVCQYRTGRHKADEIQLNLATKPMLYRLVLTLQAQPDTPLQPRIERLYKAIARLQERVYWQSRVVGGLFRLHVDYQRKTRNWHPHLDCILESTPLNRTTLSDIWHEVTGDSYILKLQVVGATEGDRERLSNYVMKPPFKGIAKSPELMADYLAAVHKRKKFQKFGRWVNTKNRHDWKKIEPALATAPVTSSAPAPSSAEIDMVEYAKHLANVEAEAYAEAVEILGKNPSTP